MGRDTREGVPRITHNPSRLLLTWQKRVTMGRATATQMAACLDELRDGQGGIVQWQGGCFASSRSGFDSSYLHDSFPTGRELQYPQHSLCCGFVDVVSTANTSGFHPEVAGSNPVIRTTRRHMSTGGDLRAALDGS